MVKGFAQCWTEAGEEPDAENSHVQAVSERHGDGVFDFVRLILRLRLRDCREQDDGEGVGDGGRKEDKGECAMRGSVRARSGESRGAAFIRGMAASEDGEDGSI